MKDKSEEFCFEVTRSIKELMDNDEEIKILECPKCGGRLELFRPREKHNLGICICEFCGKICEGRIL